MSEAVMTISEDRLQHLIIQAVKMALKGQNPKEWLTANEVAAMMERKDARTIREHIVNGEWDIKYRVTSKRRYQFQRASVERFINNHTI